LQLGALDQLAAAGVTQRLQGFQIALLDRARSFWGFGG
jgi:hypothetical protein